MSTLREVSAPKRCFEMHIIDIINTITPKLVDKCPRTKDFSVDIINDDKNVLFTLDILFGIDDRDPLKEGDIRGFNAEGTFDLKIKKGII